MKVFEKYIDEVSLLMSDINCCNKDCETCILYKTDCENSNKIKEFLMSEYKEPIRLSEDERAILMNLPSKYEYIGRDVNGLYIYVEKPKLINGCGDYRIYYGEGACFSLYHHLFDFIANEDCYSIKELLSDKNE